MGLKSIKVLTILTIIVLPLAISAAFPVFATTTPRIYLDPSGNVYITDTAYLGMKFNVTVWCSNVPDVGGAQIYLEFNDTIINVTRWLVPDGDVDFFMPEPPPATLLPAPPDPGYLNISPGKGRVSVSVSKGGLPPTPPWGHDGKICILEFNITAVPTEPGKYTSNLLIDAVDTYLLDGTGYEVPDVTKENGYYEISKLTVVHYLTISHTIGGTTDPVSGEYPYENGTTVPVTAINNSGYIFYHWKLDNVNIGATNPVNVVMDSNHTLKAVFKAVGSEGDTNGDGRVDINDFLNIVISYGAFGPDYLYPGSPAHPRWDPMNDLKTDNKCDLLDLYIVAINFGKVYV